MLTNTMLVSGTLQRVCKSHLPSGLYCVIHGQIISGRSHHLCNIYPCSVLLQVEFPGHCAKVKNSSLIFHLSFRHQLCFHPGEEPAKIIALHVYFLICFHLLSSTEPVLCLCYHLHALFLMLLSLFKMRHPEFDTCFFPRAFTESQES